jgi:hypothetical protein
MLTIALAIPARHGALGNADELLFFCLPLVIGLIVLAITSAQARRKEEQQRTRSRSKNHDDLST